MAYTYVPFIPSQDLTNKKETRDNDSARLRQYYDKGYSQGAGGYVSELNTAQQRLDNLYNNNNLSQQFNYSNQGAYDKALGDLTNRKAFSYNLADDMLYQQAKEQYQQMGRVAMEDVAGQAASMTGGYGNSYGAAAAAQAYNSHIQQLNNSIGDYYAMALNTYNSETDRLQNTYNALANDRTTQQNEWSNNWNVYNNLYSMYSNDLNNLRGLDQQAWAAQGEGLSNIANLSTTQYNNDYANESNLWQAGESLKATQAEQEEAEKHNRWTEQHGDAELNEQINSRVSDEALKKQQLSQDEALKKQQLSQDNEHFWAEYKLNKEKLEEEKKQNNKISSNSGYSSGGSSKKSSSTKKSTPSKKQSAATAEKLFKQIISATNNATNGVMRPSNQYSKTKDSIAEEYISKAQKSGKLSASDARTLYKRLGLL